MTKLMVARFGTCSASALAMATLATPALAQAAAVIASMTRETRSLATATSILSFGRKLTAYSAPR